MPTFEVVPADAISSFAAVITPDAARLLRIVERFECKEGKVFCDRSYLFSIRLDRNGLWHILRREYEAEAQTQSIAAFG